MRALRGEDHFHAVVPKRLRGSRGAGLARVVLQALRHAPFADFDSRAVRLELRGAFADPIGDGVDRTLEPRCGVSERAIALPGELVAVRLEAGELPPLARSNFSAVARELSAAALRTTPKPGPFDASSSIRLSRAGR